MMSIQEWSENILLVDLLQEPKMGEELKILIGQVQAEGKHHVAIDFSSVSIITASGFSRLLKLRKLLIDQGHQLIFCNVSPATKGIFIVTGLDQYFEFADDRFVALGILNLA